MLKSLSFKTKILAFITAIVVLGAAATLVVILVTGKNNPQSGDSSTGISSGETFDHDTSNPTESGNETSGAAMDAWGAANGYWRSTAYPTPEDNAVASDDKFVGFFKEDGVFKLEYGIYRTSYWISGEVTKVVPKGNYKTELTLRIPATPSTEMDKARPERTETIYIHEVDNRMNIRIENLGGGTWYSYEYGGNTLEQAFN